MYYFDQKLLQQYIDAGAKLKIYEDQDWYDITSVKDLSDEKSGVAYNEFGQAHYFDYVDIQKIKVGNNTYTLDQLQQHMTGKSGEGEEPKKSEPSSDTEEKPESEEPTDENPEKEPDLSWFSPKYEIGQKLLREFRYKKHKGKR